MVMATAMVIGTVMDATPINMASRPVMTAVRAASSCPDDSAGDPRGHGGPSSYHGPDRRRRPVPGGAQGDPVGQVRCGAADHAGSGAPQPTRQGRPDLADGRCPAPRRPCQRDGPNRTADGDRPGPESRLYPDPRRNSEATRPGAGVSAPNPPRPR